MMAGSHDGSDDETFFDAASDFRFVQPWLLRVPIALVRHDVCVFTSSALRIVCIDASSSMVSVCLDASFRAILMCLYLGCLQCVSLDGSIK